MLKKQKGKRKSDASELRAQCWALSLLSHSHRGQRTEGVLGLQEGTLGQATQGSLGRGMGRQEEVVLMDPSDSFGTMTDLISRHQENLH